MQQVRVPIDGQPQFVSISGDKAFMPARTSPTRVVFGMAAPMRAKIRSGI